MAEWIGDWPSMAACRTGDPDALFVQGAEQNVAKRICRGCPVRIECLADALDNRIEFGVWGGMTERERRALLRKHPAVASWRRVFEAHQRSQERLVGEMGPRIAGSAGAVAVSQESAVPATPAQRTGEPVAPEPVPVQLEAPGSLPALVEPTMLAPRPDAA